MLTETDVSQLDPTGLQRQRRHLQRLKNEGIFRKTVLVHEDCAPYIDKLKRHFRYPDSAPIFREFADRLEKVKPINVAQVSQLSPFRYPGGKTWLVPNIRELILALNKKPRHFIEPFAGGGIVGLSVAAEKLADHVVLAELDDGVAAVWEAILTNPEILCDRILAFNLTQDSARRILEESETGIQQRAFQTVLRNRVQHGGILAPGASLIKNGENGKGISSRWYPQTLVKRIRLIYLMRNNISFIHGDGFEVVRAYQNNSNSFFFIDPPYTAGGKKAGKRLYLHNTIDHEYLFLLMSKVKGNFVMTYDDSDSVRKLARNFRFKVTLIPMKNTHHQVMMELLITKS